jgi:hypothetical protein
MKTAIRFAIGIVLVSSSLAREFRPEGRLENIPASDTSVQQSYIFRTVPGVLYRVESSHDLSNWTAGEEIYGMGHEFVTAMYEFTPPPPAPPGTPPATPPVPAIHASLRIRPSSGTAGGTVVSWKSLDHGGPVIMLLAQAMTSNWNRMPLYWDRFGNHDFFIGCDGSSIPPPVGNPVLGTKDAAVFAELETSFPAINLAVDESIARSRNAPAPAPPDPNSRKFWRVFCDWSLDTDQDGSPDWAEFEMGALTTGGPTLPLRGDAFDPDTDSDGILDGEQLDLDGDGTTDAKDGDIAGGDGNGQDGHLVEWIRTPGFQLAAFDLGLTSGRIFDISDNGTVLAMETDDNGNYPDYYTVVDRNLAKHTIARGIHGFLPAGYAGTITEALFDDWVYGVHVPEVPGSPEGGPLEYCIWDPITDARLPHAESQAYDDHIMDVRNGVQVEANRVMPGNLLYTNLGPLSDSANTWFASLRIEANKNISGSNGYWRFDPETNTYGSRNPLPEYNLGGSATLIQKDPDNPATVHKWTLVAGNTGLIVAEEDGAFEQTKVTYKQGQVPIGVSNQGWVGTQGEIWNYDKWRPLSRHFGPSQPASALMRYLLDTGLSVAELDYGGVEKPYLMVPVQAEATYDTIKVGPDGSQTPVKFTHGAGVDDLSIGADTMDTAAQDCIWIMAPADSGNTNVTFKTASTNMAPLKMDGFSFLKFGASNDVELASAIQTVTVRAAAAPEATSLDVNIGLSRNGKTSFNDPLRAMIMKHRTVQVTVYKITRILANGTKEPVEAEMMPTEAQIQNHLENIFLPQINANFAVKVEPTPVEVNWDANADGVLNAPSIEDHSGDQNKILEEIAKFPAPNPAPNIRVLIVSSTTNKFTSGNNGFGMTFRPGKTCWILGSSHPDNRNQDDILDTIAHEVGHVFVGPGHPDEPGEHAIKGPAPLPGTHHDLRLMTTGVTPTTRSRALVKGEWDEAEKWMKQFVDTPTP